MSTLLYLSLLFYRFLSLLFDLFIFMEIWLVHFSQLSVVSQLHYVEM